MAEQTFFAKFKGDNNETVSGYYAQFLDWASVNLPAGSYEVIPTGTYDTVSKAA